MSDDFDNDSGIAHVSDLQKKNANSSQKHRERRRIVRSSSAGRSPVYGGDAVSSDLPICMIWLFPMHGDDA